MSFSVIFMKVFFDFITWGDRVLVFRCFWLYVFIRVIIIVSYVCMLVFFRMRFFRYGFILFCVF